MSVLSVEAPYILHALPSQTVYDFQTPSNIWAWFVTDIST